MIEPCYRLPDSRHRGLRILQRTLQQQNANAQRARSGNLPVGCIAAAVLCDHHVDRVRRQQLAVLRFTERTAREYVLCVRHTQRRIDWIHRSYDVSMLRLRCERGDRLPAHCEEHVSRLGAQRLGCSFSVGHLRPAIARHGLPRWSAQSQQRRSCLQSRVNCVGGNSFRKGMRGIDQYVDAIVTQVRREPRYAAEATASRWHGLCEWRCRASGQRQHHAQVGASGEARRELPRFGGTAKNQYASRHAVQ